MNIFSSMRGTWPAMPLEHWVVPNCRCSIDHRRLGRTRRYVDLWLVLLLGLAAPLTTWSQEALRASVTGQAALEAKKRRISTGWGDIRLGPVKLDLSSRLSLEASDNVRYREDEPEEDLIFRPGLTVRGLYPVTDKNLLSFGAGLDYNKYLKNDDLDYFYVSPDSDLAFDVYVGDFLINFHNRFHYTADVIDQASLSGMGRYGRFDNALGVLVVWDLNKVLLSINYDYLFYAATESLYDYTDHTSHLLSLRSAWLVTPMTPLGVEVGFGATDYDYDPLRGPRNLDDMEHYSAGLFYEIPAGRFTKLRLGAGYVLYEPTSNINTNLSAGDSTDAFYADLEFEHRITQHITYRLSAGQEIRAGLYSQTLQLLYARAWIYWNIIRGYGLSTYFGYENGEESGSVYYWRLEKFDRFSTGVSVSKRLNEKLTTSLGYYYYLRSSNVPGRDYAQNRLVLNLSYSF